MPEDMGALAGSREPSPTSGLGPSGFDPERIEAAKCTLTALRNYNAALRERETVSRFLTVRGMRAASRLLELPWWSLAERSKCRWVMAACIDTAKEIERGAHHEDQAAWITELGQGFLTLKTAQGIEAREGGDGETRLHRNDESPVAESDAPQHRGQP